jgi:amidase
VLIKKNYPQYKPAMPTSNPSHSEITELDATALSVAIHARQFSCREVMQSYLARIRAVNPTVNAIVSLLPDDALLAQADVCDAELSRGQSRGWMHGMPQAIKDLSDTLGLPTAMGSPLLQGAMPKQDGLMAARMKAAGCIVMGKTNVPEFGLGSHTYNPVFGPTLNPFDITRTAGGSSGGAAVALALRLLPVADGSDFMGSLRNPAGWNNVFGFRPSQGRIPKWPANDVFISQLGTEGPMARTVQDLRRLYETQAGFCVNTPLSIANYQANTWAIDAFVPQKTSIGWLGDLQGYLPMEPGILSVCEAALARFAALGCRVEPTALGMSPESIWQTWRVWRHALVAASMAPHLKAPGARAHIKPEALWEHDQAAHLTAADLMRASSERTTFYQGMLALFERFDVLALPTAQVWPFDVKERWPSHINSVQMDTYHRWMEIVTYATLAGLPCISVPAGFDERGLPMGLQLIGKPQGDLELLRVAEAYEGVAGDALARRPSERRI